ncbi:MAG: hypothetical protein U0527_09860 [Candidatus Eisenbacteria bacterium]
MRVLTAGRFEGGVLRRQEWDGRDAVGRAVPAGVYFAQLRTGGEAQAVKLLLAR